MWIIAITSLAFAVAARFEGALSTASEPAAMAIWGSTLIGFSAILRVAMRRRGVAVVPATPAAPVAASITNVADFEPMPVARRHRRQAIREHVLSPELAS